LSNFLLKNDFKRGQVDTTLFKKTLEKDILIVQIYVDDIIFGSSNASLCKEFSKLMQEEFEMNMMGELKFFLGIQINQCKDGVYVHQSKYTKEAYQTLTIIQMHSVVHVRREKLLRLLSNQNTLFLLPELWNYSILIYLDQLALHPYMAVNMEWL